MLVSGGGTLFGKLFGPHVELFGSVYGLDNAYIQYIMTKAYLAMH